MELFNLVGMFDNYESRKVDRWESDDGVRMVSTAAVTDSEQPYETAIRHPMINDGGWVVVEMYESKSEAQAGHDKWAAKVQAEDVDPEQPDVSTSGIRMLLAAVTGE